MDFFLSLVQGRSEPSSPSETLDPLRFSLSFFLATKMAPAYRSGRIWPFPAIGKWCDVIRHGVEKKFTNLPAQFSTETKLVLTMLEFDEK